jgi:hypothetical protein
MKEFCEILWLHKVQWDSLLQAAIRNLDLTIGRSGRRDFETNLESLVAHRKFT